MKTLSLAFIFFLSIFFICCAQKSGPYIDGVYFGKSQAMYTGEPYIGFITISIKNGWPIKVDFKIVDSTNNENINESYEKHFAGNEVYIEQCRNDCKGIQSYPKKLIQNQDVDKIDAVSGATWSYNFFKYATLDALKNAKKTGHSF